MEISYDNMSSVNNADISIMLNPTTSDSLSSLDQQAISLFEQAIKKNLKDLCLMLLIYTENHLK